MFNRFPQITCVFDRRKIATPSTKSSLEIRVTYNRKQKYISTGIKLYSNQWKNGKIVNCPDILQVSEALNSLLSKVRTELLRMLQEDNIDLSLLSSRLTISEAKETTFLDFCKKRAVIRKYGKEKDTQERYDRFLKLFSLWGRIQYFEDVKEDAVIAYDKYLEGLGMKPYSKWNNYHRFLNGFIQDAVDDGLLQRNPYNWINIDKEKTSMGLEKCLTLKEFNQLKDAEMPTKCLERVRDLFIFQTYTCLRYSDLAKFNCSDITVIDNTKVYRFTQKKTKKQTVIPLLKQALDILGKYNYSLPIISNVKYNAYLKVVSQAAKLEHPLSTHWARHTGATLLLNEGVDMKIVTKICGHSSTRITEQIYAKLLDETVVNAVSNLKI